MPLTVITLKNVPSSLKGDLSKWMQEIATGVYVGNFNVKIRESLWDRITQNISVGEATLSYASRNEIGYAFDTHNTERYVIDSDGIPLIYKSNVLKENDQQYVGKSNASRYRRAKRFSGVKPQAKT